ncbi:MAG: hypothetical protein ACJ8AS_08980 [Hyphomicrobiales bacterium]
MRATRAVKFSGINVVMNPFIVNGGRYAVTMQASAWDDGGDPPMPGNVTLEALGPDGSTWFPVSDAFSSDGYTAVDIPPGQCRLAIDICDRRQRFVASMPVGERRSGSFRNVVDHPIKKVIEPLCLVMLVLEKCM